MEAWGRVWEAGALREGMADMQGAAALEPSPENSTPRRLEAKGHVNSPPFYPPPPPLLPYMPI